jgi:hypothetical protein
MRAFWVGMISAVALAGCYESAPTLSQDEEKLFDAVMYLFTGIEDNTVDGDSTLWRRTVKGRTVEYAHIGRNGIGFSDDALNKKTRDSLYVRYLFRLSSPERCAFRFEDVDQFSKGDSQEDFSVYS